MLCEYIRALGLYDDSADHGKKFFWLEITNLNIHNYLDRRYYSQNYEITNIGMGNCAIASYEPKTENDKLEQELIRLQLFSRGKG